MWIVRLALRRPYTFVVAAILLIVLSVGVLRRAPTDIFPSVDIPVINVVWTYGGLSARQMEQQITQFSETSLAGNVEGIRTIESQTFDGVTVIRLYLHPSTDVSIATSQVTAISQTILRRMPTGTQPPVIVRYNASSVPIMQIAFSSDTMSESEIYDYVNLRVRSQLSAIRGVRFPLPMGGRVRQTVVDLNPEALRARGVSPNDVAVAIAQQNLTLPTGSAKIGETEFRVSLNSSPESISALNDVPIRARDGRVLFVRDVAFVHDGYAAQTAIARYDGRRAVVLSAIKTGDASTTEVAARIRAMFPTIRAAAPRALRMELLADQSTFVRKAIDGLLTEGLIAAALTAAMILLFLGSWRSTLVVFVSIPLSVLSALLVMRAMGHTINTMTLGGLALAVGILVDDATVEIENIHRNLSEGKPLTRAILDGAQQVAVPAFVASLSIGMVFCSVLLLEGPARYLFLPLGLSVGLSVMASYVLSRTLVPTMVRWLLPAEIAAHEAPPGLFGRAQRAFERGFDGLRAAYASTVSLVLRRRLAFLLVFAAVIGAAGASLSAVGRDFFPVIDAGQIRLHITAPPGTRLEQTERHFAAVEAAIAELIPRRERELILSQLGMPGGFTLAVTDSANVSTADGELLLRLSPSRTKSTEQYRALLRARLRERFPELQFYFQPADIVTQILNFGLPSPISLKVTSQNREAALAGARRIERALRSVRGVVDVRVHQVMDAPRMHVEVDRSRAAELGLTQRDVANDVLLAVSSSGQVAPNYWTDPATGNSYPVVVSIPEHRVSSYEALAGLPIGSGREPPALADIARIDRRTTPVNTARTDLQPTFEVRADIAWRDLGSVAGPIEAIAKEAERSLPPGGQVLVMGQIDSMKSAFAGIGLGLLLAVLLVYALMVVNFQSWLDPFIILLALPGAGAGIVAALYITGTTLNVPSLMGAVMSVGVGTANSTLLVSFANALRTSGQSAAESAREAAVTRLRPVLMTALAMVIGMLPMALGHSEGGEQNAALARSAIGGLMGATFATLLFVPVAYSVLRAKSAPRVETDPDLMEAA
ncbi:MAG: efflux RND transporter permease subunit [Polyangiales bacterium]